MNTLVVLAALSLACISYGDPYGDYGGEYYYKVTCPKLPAPVDGSVELSGRKQSTATYSCNEGFNLEGAQTRKCLRDGQWSGEAPVCQIVDCGQPDKADPNGRVQVRATTYLSTAVYSCNPGYLLDTATRGGSQVVTCQDGGQWSDTAPGCLPFDCGHLPSPANGNVRFVPDTTFRSKARFRCNRGYKLEGLNVRECEATGWSGKQPRCKEIKCPKLRPPKHGRVTVSGRCVDDYAVYRCEFRYELNGPNRRVCQEDGTWSDEEPECVSMDFGYGGQI